MTTDTPPDSELTVRLSYEEVAPRWDALLAATIAIMDTYDSDPVMYAIRVAALTEEHLGGTGWTDEEMEIETQRRLQDWATENYSAEGPPDQTASMS